MNRLDRKRPQIDPKKLRKHSHIVASKQDPFLVVGDRVQTDFGITVSGAANKAFETQYMVVVPNSMTPTWKHAKKVRVYRVISGSGYYQESDDAGTVTTKPLSAGDEVIAEPGKSHRLTSGVIKLELYVTQEAKYEANLEEVAPVEKIADVDASELHSLTAHDKFLTVGEPVGRRRNSRAAEQIAAQRGDAVALNRINQKLEKSENFFRNGASAGINAMPVMDFSEEGAG